jgi:hypothetical protein
MDPVTVLDGSAKQIHDPTWLTHLSEGGGHYYGNIADLYAGFDGPDGDGYLGMTMPEKSMTQPWNNTMPVTTDPMPQ